VAAWWRWSALTFAVPLPDPDRRACRASLAAFTRRNSASPRCHVRRRRLGACSRRRLLSDGRHRRIQARPVRSRVGLGPHLWHLYDKQAAEPPSRPGAPSSTWVPSPASRLLCGCPTCVGAEGRRAENGSGLGAYAMFAEAPVSGSRACSTNALRPAHHEITPRHGSLGDPRDRGGRRSLEVSETLESLETSVACRAIHLARLRLRVPSERCRPAGSLIALDRNDRSGSLSDALVLGYAKLSWALQTRRASVAAHENAQRHRQLSCHGMNHKHPLI
jgi:hypothetical protein